MSSSGDESPAHEYMKLALEQAKLALHNLEVPVGCVIVEDGKVIASGSNRTTETRNPKEITVILELIPKLAIKHSISHMTHWLTLRPIVYLVSPTTNGTRSVGYQALHIPHDTLVDTQANCLSGRPTTNGTRSCPRSEDFLRIVREWLLKRFQSSTHRRMSISPYWRWPMTHLQTAATRHAEMEAIDILLEQWQKSGFSQLEVAEKFSRCDLYVTCEPCIMCAAALSILGIRAVYYGCANDKFGGCGSILSLHSTTAEQFSSRKAFQEKGFKCTGGIMASEAISLLRSFYDQGNPNAPKPHRPVQISQ